MAATAPQDSDITRCLWLPPTAVLQAPNLRSPLVAESVRLWQQNVRYPLTLISAFQWPFSEGAQRAGA